MAKKKSPNAALIEALTPAKPIPYDPELMQAMGDAHRREWQNLETLRREVYRHVMPNVWLEVLEAEKAGDAERVKAIEIAADQRWSQAMGAQPLTSWSNLEIVMAKIKAAGYPSTDAGLHAWTIDKAPQHAPTEPFVPNKMQADILRVLNGRALTKQAIADEILNGESSRLYNSKTRKGDINELRDLGLVDNKRRLGFFRPDAPPVR